MTTFSLMQWLILLGAALLVGISKTALPGLVSIAVAMFAAVLPAKASTGSILLLLLVGDAVATVTYFRHVDWELLHKIFPPVVVGVALGYLFLAHVSDSNLQKTIGWLILFLCALGGRVQLAQFFPARSLSGPESCSPLFQKVVSTLAGVTAGFTTMAANAGGPVISLYFLWSKFNVKRFLGTTAWFFFLVNLTKFPFSVAAGAISATSFTYFLPLAFCTLLGTFWGRALANKIPQRIFDPIVFALSVISGVYLVV
ncbi:MAG: sulfite exporter TauE/SafE family protein [Actinomycetaceae bacterium]|nr:sulfite exporter TauE/SafE family protein [Actinomycetaceae bacterium]